MNVLGTAAPHLLLPELRGAPVRMGLRAFKAERELEVWVSSHQAGPMRLVATFPIAGLSGTAGPKRKEGDRQVPEGFYFVDRYNPSSAFHLSLGIDYPNRADRIKGDPVRPGSDIFIHGSNVSIGCLAMTDPVIEAIYSLADSVRRRGGRIPVHIYPCRMEPARVRALTTQHQEHRSFWQTLQPGYDAFRWSHEFRAPSVDRRGEYVWRFHRR